MKRPATAPPPCEGEPVMPTSAGAAVEFMGGKILPSEARGGWRVWVDKTIVARDKYGHNKKQSFKEAVAYIKASYRGGVWWGEVGTSQLQNG